MQYSLAAFSTVQDKNKNNKKNATFFIILNPFI
ncbi:hypothetical protein CCO0877 [Campylobacter coli RM2228]|nr:hypothetical protein CCO0877 [Campylobacter coli RM2228]